MNISVNTAQNVTIEYNAAGVGYRILSTLIDLSLQGGVLIVAVIVGSAFDATPPFTVVALFFAVLYHLLCELFLNGRSIGKMTLKMQVIRLDGKKLTFWDCILRWVFRLIDVTILMGSISVVFIIVTSKTQRLGDLAAGTTVVCLKTSMTLKEMNQYETPDNYIPLFPQVSLLSDRDMSIIKEIFHEVETTRDYELLEPLSARIKELTGIETDMRHLPFIRTVLLDYTHITRQ